MRKKNQVQVPVWVVTLKLAAAMRKQESMPRERPILGCSDTPWVLNINTHLVRCHATMPPNTIDFKEWVAVSRDDENKRWRPRNIPVLLKPEITLKVAKAVDSEDASYIEASLGCSD